MVWLAVGGCDRGTADDVTVLRNGIVLPVDAQHTALAIDGARVIAVGSDEEVLRAAGRRARVIDLDRRTVLPGFIEPHMHFALMAGLGHLPDVGPFQRPTFDDALDALDAITEIREEAARSGPDEWVMGRQFDPILLEPPRDLTTRDLDPIVPDRPAFFLNASGHIAYVNSRLRERRWAVSSGVGHGLHGRRELGPPLGAGIDGSAPIQNSLIAFNHLGEGARGAATLTCCDVIGNEGGDWVGPIADQLGTDGNLLAFPLFCEPGVDYTLMAHSPCLPQNNPGGAQIGAFGLGCVGPVSLERDTWARIKGPVPLEVHPGGGGGHRTRGSGISPERDGPPVAVVPPVAPPRRSGSASRKRLTAWR